ncbi:PCK1 [Cordylochernes scorpioides]|uniref:PCK1 n=1 Tax=Cordylochernes scorpioides TaxID=51811 RepID=A0ABY6K3I1_9ARAC|nr:PCK1 [Cordylochernes scorpioides]
MSSGELPVREMSEIVAVQRPAKRYRRLQRWRGGHAGASPPGRRSHLTVSPALGGCGRRALLQCALLISPSLLLRGPCGGHHNATGPARPAPSGAPGVESACLHRLRLHRPVAGPPLLVLSAVRPVIQEVFSIIDRPPDLQSWIFPVSLKDHTITISSAAKLLTKGCTSKDLIQNGVRNLSVVHGDLSRLKPKVRSFVEDQAKLCQPDQIHICDGSEAENDYLLNLMQKHGMIMPLPKYDNWRDWDYTKGRDMSDVTIEMAREPV